MCLRAILLILRILSIPSKTQPAKGRNAQPRLLQGSGVLLQPYPEPERPIQTGMPSAHPRS